MAGPLDGAPQDLIDSLPSLGELKADPIWKTLSPAQQQAVSDGWRQHVVTSQSWYKAKGNQSPDATADVKNARAAAIMGRPQDAFAPDAPNLSTPVSQNPVTNFAAGAYNKSLMGAMSQAVNQGQPVFGATEPQSFGGQLAQQGAAMALDTPAYLAAGGLAGVGKGLTIAGKAATPLMSAMIGGGTAMALPGVARDALQTGDPIHALTEGAKQFGVGAATMGVGNVVGGASRFAQPGLASAAQKYLATTGAEAATMTGANAYLNGAPTLPDGSTDWGQLTKDLASNAILTGGMKAAGGSRRESGNLDATMAADLDANKADLAQQANPGDFTQQQALVQQIGQRIQTELAKGPAADTTELHDLKNQYQMASAKLQTLVQSPNEAAQKGFAATQGATAGDGFITYPKPQEPGPILGRTPPEAPQQIEGPPQRLMLPPGQDAAGLLPPGQDHGFTTEPMQQGGSTATFNPSLRPDNPYGDNIRDQVASGPRQIEGPPQPVGLLPEPPKPPAPFGPDDQSRLDTLTDTINNLHDQLQDPKLANKPQRAFNLGQRLKSAVDEATQLRGRRAADAEQPAAPPAPNPDEAAASAQGVEQQLRAGKRPSRAAVASIWQRLLSDEGGSSNFHGMLADLADRYNREEAALDPDLLSRARPTGQRSGHDVYTIRGQEWEHAGTNANGREIMHRYPTADQLSQSAGVGARINGALQPLQNAGENAASVRSAGNMGRMGDVLAGKFVEDLRSFTAEQKARMHKVLDDPNNVGGHGIQLTAPEQAMVNRAKTLLDEAGNEGVRSGVLNGKRDIYAPHLYEEFLNKIFDNRQPGQGGALSTSTPHSKERTFDYLHQAEAAGLHPVYDISSVADVYRGMKRKVAAADLISDLKGSVGADGRPLVQDAETAPRDYVNVNNQAFRSQAVHPQVAAAVKAYAENNTSAAERLYMKAKQTTIGYQLLYPMIHFSNVAGKTIWKNGFNLGGDLRTGHEAWNDEARVRDAVSHDLNLQGNSLGPIHEILDGAYGEMKDGLLRQIDNKATGGVVSKVIDGAHHLLWDNVRALQLGTYERAWRTMVDQGVNIDEAKKSAAYMANNWMGMIPREEMSDGLRRFANVALYSRGWTLGNIKSYEVAARGDKALPPDLAGTQGGKYVANAMRQSVALDTVARMASLAVANGIMSQIVLGKWQWPWDNEPTKQDRVLIGKKQDGTLIYSQLPVFKFTDDLLQSLPFKSKFSEGNPGAYWSNKTAPGAKAVGESLFNADSRGEKIYKDTDPFWQRFAMGADHILQGNLPGYDMVRYAGSGKMADDAKSLANMPRQAQAAYAISKALGAGVSKGATGGQDAAAMMANRKVDDAQRADIIPRFNKLAKDEATRQQAMELLVDAKDQNGDPLFKRGEIFGMAKSAAESPDVKVAKYEARHPGFAAAQGAR